MTKFRGSSVAVRSAKAGLLCGLLAAAAHGQNTRYLDPVFSTVDVVPNIQFAEAFDLGGNPWKLGLDLYRPSGDDEEHRPAVVIVHGGGFLSGSKAMPQYVELATRMAQRGYVAVSIDYRLAENQMQKNLFYADIVENAKEDFQAAVSFVRANAAAWGVDGSRLCTMGASAGATTNLEGTYVEQDPQPAHSSEIQACVDMWGLLNSLEEMKAGDAPVFIVHGTLDTTVPYQHALNLKARAEEVGVPHAWHPMVGSGHADWGTFWASYYDLSLEFLYEHLSLGKLSGLAAQPGYSAPGSLSLEAHGVAGDLRLLGWSFGEVSLSLEPLGTLCLDLSSLGFMGVLPIPGAEGVQSQVTSAAVPAGLAGTTLFFQELHSTSAGIPRLLTNCVEVGF